MTVTSPDPPGRASGRGRRAGVVALVCVVAVVAGVLAWTLWPRPSAGSSGRAGSTSSAVGTPVAVDRPAPSFRLPALSGDGSVRLGPGSGAVVVLTFWASWCTPCRTEMPQLDRLWRTYRGRGVRFVGVDYEDRRAAGLAFSRRHGPAYATGFDGAGSVGDSFAIYGLPTTFVVGPDLRIRFIVRGRIRAPALAAALDSLLATSPSS